MADNRTMEEMLQAPTKGYVDAIVVPYILVENFEIRTGLLSLIQANQFHGFESNNPHDRISNTIANPRGDLKAITTQSGVSYDEPAIPPHFSYLPKVVGQKKLSLPELTATRMILELADRSTTRPADIAEDVFVKVGKFHFPTDFIVVDYVVNPRVPLILWRPILRIRRALIDVYGKELTLCVDDEAITFKVGQTSKYSYNDVESINLIDVIDVACEDLEEIEACLTRKSIPSGIDDTNFDLEGGIRLIEKLLNDDPSSYPFPPIELNMEEIKTIKSSIDEPPELELKELPSHLEYAFLDVFKPAVQHQRRVNPKIHEVIKKEVIKLLDAGLIYSIFDSSWVSPVHCVPKKGGMTVIENEDNELIPTSGLIFTEMPMTWSHGVTLVNVKYGVTHRLSTVYHPQTSGQVEVSNRGLKRILERTIGENRTSWSDKLDDALLAFRTAFKTPIGCTTYKLVYEKACHLPIKLEHKAYWALNRFNFDLKTTGDHEKVQLNELNELPNQAYENSLIYKEKTKKIHDFKIKNHVFNIGDRVLLFKSRLKIFSGELKTRWTEPFTVAQVFPYGTVDLSQTDEPNFKVERPGMITMVLRIYLGYLSFVPRNPPTLTHIPASIFELVEPLLELERTPNQRLHRRNRRVPFDQRNNPLRHPRIVYPLILNINYFRNFLDILQNYDPMDDEPMWVVDHVVALTPSSAITILETANEFAIKGNHLTLVKGNQFDGRTKTDPHKRIHAFFGICDMFKYRDTKNEAVRLMMFPLSLTGEAKTWFKINQEVINATASGIFLYKTPNQAYQLLEDKVILKLDWVKKQKTKSSLKKTVDFADEGNSNFDTDRIMAQMDAMTLKIDAQYKELYSNAKKTKPDLNDDDTPMSREEEAKFMQTFRKTRFHNDYRDRDLNHDNWRSKD
nr:reverse transcriptase domain-containing protein [Tanacetum cinerariifolium]